MPLRTNPAWIGLFSQCIEGGATQCRDLHKALVVYYWRRKASCKTDCGLWVHLWLCFLFLFLFEVHYEKIDIESMWQTISTPWRNRLRVWGWWGEGGDLLLWASVYLLLNKHLSLLRRKEHLPDAGCSPGAPVELKGAELIFKTFCYK